jgi:serine/threonine-protein kinase
MDASTWPGTGPGGFVRAGSWTIERALGGGPVSDSFVASRGREIAVVRVLREPWASDGAARTEWARASWAANHFQHGRVARVVEQAEDERGAPIVVRAWAMGASLEEAVRRGAVDRATALRISEQLLDALEMAHAHGVLHGALSPRNVVITPRGTARLLDFATTPGLRDRRSTSDALASARSGPFLAPERCSTNAGAATELSDVWGAGACLYYALTGVPPASDQTREAPLGFVSEDVASVVLLATEPDPDRRYQSAYAMLGDVRRVLAGKEPVLDGSTGQVPSQRVATLPQSSSGLRGLREPPELPSLPPSGGQWRGNLLLVAAIAALAGLATFVLVRERLGDEPASSMPPPAASEDGR